MIWRVCFIIGVCSILWCGASYPQSNIIGSGVTGDIKVASVGCSQATAFLARNGNAHPTETTTLICGLVSASIWSGFDTFYITATDTLAHAELNAVGATCTLASVGTPAPTFTSNQGMAGATGTGWFDNGCNIGGTNFTLNSASTFAWVVSGAANPNIGIWGSYDGTTYAFNGFPLWAAGTVNVYLQLNDRFFESVTLTSGTTATATGFFGNNRGSSTTVDFYWNGSSNTGNASVSSQIPVADFCIGSDCTATDTGTGVVGMAATGRAFTPTEWATIYSLAHAYMQSVAGVP